MIGCFSQQPTKYLPRDCLEHLYVRIESRAAIISQISYACQAQKGPLSLPTCVIAATLRLPDRLEYSFELSQPGIR